MRGSCTAKQEVEEECATTDAALAIATIIVPYSYQFVLLKSGRPVAIPPQLLDSVNDPGAPG